MTPRQLSRLGAGALALACLLGCAPIEVATAPRATPRSDVPAWSDPIDVADFRTRYAERGGLRERCESDRPLDAAYMQADAADWKALVELSGRWLERCPIDIDFNRLRAKALYEVRRMPESQDHMRWFRELVAAALASGDGSSAESAYVVLTVSEEYALMRALEVTPLRQLWAPDGVHAYEVRSGAGRTSTLYFNPSTRMSRLLHEAPLE